MHCTCTCTITCIQCSLYISDTLGQESCSVIQRCPLCGGYFIHTVRNVIGTLGAVRYWRCPL